VTSLPDDDESLERLANVGELAGLLVHEFTDFLNMLMLQISVLELRLPRDQLDDLTEIRRHGERVSALVGRFHAYRRGKPSRADPVDLNLVVRAEAARLDHEPGSEVQLQVDTRATAPMVRGPRTDVQRLVHFLTSNAIRAAAHSGHLARVATEADDKQVRLLVEDAGPPMPESDLPYLFHPAREGRRGVDVLEVAACQSLSRRLGGTITAESLAQGGLRFTVSFPREIARA
jgi:signal transduction histidine kinase